LTLSKHKGHIALVFFDDKNALLFWKI